MSHMKLSVINITFIFQCEFISLQFHLTKKKTAKNQFNLIQIYCFYIYTLSYCLQSTFCATPQCLQFFFFMIICTFFCKNLNSPLFQVEVRNGLRCKNGAQISLQAITVATSEAKYLVCPHRCSKVLALMCFKLGIEISCPNWLIKCAPFNSLVTVSGAAARRLVFCGSSSLSDASKLQISL